MGRAPKRCFAHQRRLERFENPSERWRQSYEPIFRCPVCRFDGYREQFDANALSVDRALGLPLRYEPRRP